MFQNFQYTLTTPGIICDPDTQLGAIIVHLILQLK